MASTYQLLFDGTPADADFYNAVASLEVEENADLPGALQLRLAVARTPDGDLTLVGDDRFRPLANLAVVSAAEGGSPECVFDGYVLSHKLHLEPGATSATLEVYGQDASWLMNLEEKVREWVDVTDVDVAESIFGEYGITAADDNAAEDAPAHPESGHSLMQRGSDIQFLRGLARRNGRLCRVACRDSPGQYVGYFARPDLDASPAVTLSPNDPDGGNVGPLDFSWDVARPSAVAARQALFTDDDEDGVDGGTDDADLPLLDARGLADFAGRPMTVLLAAPVDDAQELAQRARSLLREAGWFVRCEGEADAARLGAILRVGTVAAVEGVGGLFSGNYLVWSVRHKIEADSHKMAFVLLRNAVGPAAGGGGLGGLLG